MTKPEELIEQVKIHLGVMHQSIVNLDNEVKAIKGAVIKDNNKKTAIGQWFLNIKNYLFTTGQFKKKDFENKQIIKENESIYPQTGKTVGSYCKYFHWVNIFFKNVIFVPGLLLLDKVIGKKLENGVEATWYNKNLTIFDKSWSESVDIMDRYVHKGFNKHKSYEIVRKMALTLILNDTITREFMNVFIHTITKNMQKAYKGHKEVYHVFYGDTNAYNPVYFNMIKSIMADNIHPTIAVTQHVEKQVEGIKKMIKKEKNPERLIQLKDKLTELESKLKENKSETVKNKEGNKSMLQHETTKTG